MVRSPLLAASIILATLIPVASVRHASGATLPITATVTSTEPQVPQKPSVELRGYAAPNASIVVQRDNTKVGSGSANAAGVFDITLTNQPTGPVTYILYFTDEGGHQLAPLTLTFNLQNGVSTIMSGVFAGPSIGINRTTVKIGDPIELSGTTVPLSTVTVIVHSTTPQTYSLSADTSGIWQLIINTKQLEVGTHVANANARTADNTQSFDSQDVTFVINPLGKCDGKNSADLNCDGYINLTDFSILLYFWKTVSPANPRADINHDGIVSIVDFSIMLYQWTG